MLFLKAFGVWLLILVCAVLNGGLREALLLTTLGKPAALVLSGISLSAVVIAISLAFVRRLSMTTAAQAVTMGSFWLALTLLFEFGFGRFAQQQSWQELLDAYTFKDGNIWPLVVAVIQFAPLIALKLRRTKT